MAWEHSGSSANILRYRKVGTKVWASVVYNTFRFERGEVVHLPAATYDLTFYEEGVGEIGRCKYTPAKTPNPIALAPRVVARLAKEATGR